MLRMKKSIFVILTVLVLLFSATIQAEAPADSAGSADAAAFRKVRNVVPFGRYEQDNNPSNGPEPIQWIVLDYEKEENKALLLSRYGLEARPYNTESVAITWENCTLRKWLNSEFLLSAFSAEEQAAILMTNVDNSASQGYSEWDMDGGNNTRDQIFLLSYAEANQYLKVVYNDRNNVKARVEPTAYAIAQGAMVSRNYKTADRKACGWWWLRSPGDGWPFIVAIVSPGGKLRNRGVYLGEGVARPAMWVNLNSDIFN